MVYLDLTRKLYLGRSVDKRETRAQLEAKFWLTCVYSTTTVPICQTANRHRYF